MALKKLREEYVEDKEITGEVVDGQKKLLKCSNCNEKLVELWVVRPKDPDVYRVSATCPFCKDKSFAVTIEGGYMVGYTDKVCMSECEHTYNGKDKTMDVNIITALRFPQGK